ncbi:tubulin-specific chaperone C [Anopheles ziemanni]|uniref:tubulin-specific chaperone C n=1 Tax=Anopheles coustani TaxID=139045 RepID=UPI002658F097|nr:tubulin-specific chaperone C [Anopheles coustani]XP_058166743.1 tubulin-specific chaperone C [Anopheles ziemanni]
MEDFIETGAINGKEKITEILNRRHKERELHIQAAKLERKKGAESTEALEYFETSFEEKVKHIRNTLDTVAGSDSKAQVFAASQNEIYELQKYLSSSTFFLNEYCIKVCQNTINELSKQLDTLRNELLPKKKFGFKSKKIVKMISEKDGKDKDEKDLSQATATSGDDHIKWTVSDRVNQLIRLPRAVVNEQTITASKLRNCLILLEGYPGSLQFAQLDNCVVVCGPTARSIFLDACTDCKFVVACQQLRCHRSRSCDMYLNVTSRAIIEDCKGIRVARYNFQYKEIEEDFRYSGLDLSCNNWSTLDDFNWLSTDKPSPNWELLREEDTIVDWSPYLERFQLQHSLTSVDH